MKRAAVVMLVAVLAIGCEEFTPTVSDLGDGLLHVDTAPGVTLEVLDWGGEGDALVLLAGGGSTAHSFADFAPRLTEDFRVLGITRRGIGASDGSSPDGIGDHVDDIEAVVRALGLRSVVLAGHSFAGMELHQFGMRHPELCRGLIYLDAANDPTDAELGRILTESPPPPAPPQDLSSVEAFRAWSLRTQGFAMPAEEIRARREIDDSGAIVGVVPHTSMAVRPVQLDWDEVECPSLGLFPVVAPLEEWLPYYMDGFESSSEAERAAAERYVADFGAWTAEQRAAFAAQPTNEVVEFPARGHYFFLTHPEEVTPVVREWASRLQD